MQFAPRDEAPVAVRWRAGVELPDHHFDDLGSGHDLLEAVTSYGAAMVTGVPTDAAGSAALAQHLGPVRETDFGRFFDIVTEPDVWEMSQSDEALDPHTDDPYRYTPSGMSILHCVASAGRGGESVLVDGFEVAASIRDEQPEHFELLSSLRVPWIRFRADGVDQGAAVDLRADAPVIKVDPAGEVTGIRFHERSLGTLPAGPDADLAERWYRSLIDFVQRVRSPEFQWRHRLEAGEAIVFDNQRVLHGRTGFEGDAGRRHLRLCTVDRELVHSRLRLLRRQHGAEGVDARLPSGNLS